MIRAFGEAALLVETGDAAKAQALAESIARDPIAGVVAAVPGLESVLAELDPLVVRAADVESELLRRLADAAPVAGGGRERTIPVVYGGEWGPDLAEVARLAGLSESEVVEAHSALQMRVLFDGFAPGFAYIGQVPERLRVARLGTPRTATPAGSVALAGAMCGIYPARLPGGWRVIGRTAITLFDPRREPPAYLVPGDTVRFRAIGAEEWDRHLGAPDDWA